MENLLSNNYTIIIDNTDQIPDQSNIKSQNTCLYEFNKLGDIVLLRLNNSNSERVVLPIDKERLSPLPDLGKHVQRINQYATSKEAAK